MPSTKQNLTVFTGVTSANTEPATATEGVDLGQMRHPNEIVCMVHSTAGTSSNTVTVKAWGYHSVTSKWYPLGTDATAENKGLLNEGNAIAAMTIDADDTLIRHVEIIKGLRGFDRLYLEVVTVTAATVEAVIAARDLGNRS